MAAWAERLRQASPGGPWKLEELDALAVQMDRWPDLQFATRYDCELKVVVDRERAQFSAWYEMFPRSTTGDGRHGTFADCIARLPYVAEMGFDVLYLPPIHPVGQHVPQGPQQRGDRRGGRAGQSVGDRRGRGGAQGDPAGVGHARENSND